MKKILILLIIIFSTAFFYGCSNNTIDPNKPVVAVSIIPEAAFVQEITGNLVTVITVIPPGYSPGNYEPNAKTMEDITKASVYFTIGVPTEAGNILPNISNVPMVHLEDIVSQAYPDRTFSDGGRDPHIWLSTKRAIVMVNAIEAKLSELDPDNASIYKANADAFITNIEAVDAQIENIFSDITMNKFIVYHPSYGYFAEDYGLDMIALQQNGKEATAPHLQDVIDIANQYNIHQVFIQAEIDSTQVISFADEIHAQVVTLYPLSDQYCDNLINMANAIKGALK